MNYSDQVRRRGIRRLFLCALAGGSVMLAMPAGAKVLFDQPFSPQAGLTASVEKPWRQEICLNGLWKFQPVPLPAGYDISHGAPLLPPPRTEAWSETPIRIPSPWNVNAGRHAHNRMFPSYPKEWESARMGWLTREFTVPDSWRGQRLLIHFEAVFGDAEIVVNGVKVGENFESSLPFEVDVTDLVRFGEPNTLLVGVRQASLFDVPGKYGKLVYGAGPPFCMHYAGIWQDVYLQARPQLNVENIGVRPWVDRGELELAITVRNNTPHEQHFQLGGDIRPWIDEAGHDVLSAPVPKWSLGDSVLEVRGRNAPAARDVMPGGTTVVTLRQPIGGELKFWTPDSPNLYGLVLDLEQNGKTIDRRYERFGWRQWGISGTHVTLNGQPIQLLGDAATMDDFSTVSTRYVWARYKTLKEVGANAVRLHVVIRPRFYLDLADEMGLAVLDESQVWASAMDYNYQAPDTFLRIGAQIDRLVMRDRNHASVFGWSIANEILSSSWWEGMPRELWPAAIDGTVALADRVRALDPTRAWVSSDGDGDFDGRLPAYVYHYGKPHDWKRDAPENRPFGIGEGGSMVWGSPAVFSAYNGERSYENLEGMMEGAAIEAYWYLSEERKMAAYCSLFTFEFLGFERLPLGMEGPPRKPTEADGVFFSSYKEGQPGLQPERLGPYLSAFNPGFDPHLPLYKPTPVHEAYEAAYAPGGPRPSRWDHRPENPPWPAPPPTTITGVGFAGAVDGALSHALDTSGIAQAAGESPSLLVVDGATLSQPDVAAAKLRMDRVLRNKGTVFVWANRDNLARVNALLPAAITLEPDEADELYADRKAPETASISLASLYFRDQADPTVMKFGLAGPLVERSRVLLRSNEIDRRWAGVSLHPPHPAMIATEVEGGRLIVTSLPADVTSPKRLELMRHLFANLGVNLGEPSDAHDTGFDGAGYLRAALVAGGYQKTGERYPAILEEPFLPDEGQLDPQPGDAAGERQWFRLAPLDDGTFDFSKLKIPGTDQTHARSLGRGQRPESLDANGYMESTAKIFYSRLPGINTAAYLSFWVYSPRATAAGSGELNLEMRIDDGVKLWINHDLIYENNELRGPGVTDPVATPVALQAGWNHFLVKSATLDGPWVFAARFSSEDAGLLKTLRSAAVRP
jgi:beta-galactosidase